MFQFTRPRGARHEVATVCQMPQVSIHAPTRGATADTTTPALTADVSIHAPTRGATGLGRVTRPAQMFQFTRPRGARHNAAAKLTAGGVFQFTRPRGARLAQITPFRGNNSFNSRAHEGRDGGDFGGFGGVCRFNSRAHEGRDTIYFIIFRGGNARGIFREPPFSSPFMFKFNCQRSIIYMFLLHIMLSANSSRIVCELRVRGSPSTRPKVPLHL